MKKLNLIITVYLSIILVLAGCTSIEPAVDEEIDSTANIEESTSTENISNADITVENSVENSIDYKNETDFEKALNANVQVAGKIVSFKVNAYKPDSAMGINCWSGEHLNFISDNELNVKKGDIVIGRIKEQPIDFFGSWWVPYELIEIIPVNSETETEKSTVKIDKITVTMSEEQLKKMTTADAEKKLRDMGFTVFEYRTVDTNKSSDLDGKIGAVEIKNWEFGKGDFSKGDTYENDAIVVLYSYRYEEPEKPKPVSYSTNDYETAKKGNTGVFSYKNKSGSYDIYWIIDFDAGYVYWFTEGNGETTCDKVKIVSGDLNDRITVTWNDNGNKWTWYLHFKYKNQPETLVVNDHDGLVTEFITTDLDDTLNIRNTRTIKEY